MYGCRVVYGVGVCKKIEILKYLNRCYICYIFYADIIDCVFEKCRHYENVWVLL